MRYGVQAEDQKISQEERVYTRVVIAPGGESLAEQPVEYTQEVAFESEDGSTLPAFTLGLHDPFDTKHPTMFTGG